MGREQFTRFKTLNDTIRVLQQINKSIGRTIKRNTIIKEGE